MTPEFDFIIIGSGPAGVSAAFPLVEAGLKVLMLDGGKEATLNPLTNSYLTERRESTRQWEWMIGKDFYALKNLGESSPKLRIPGHEYVFDQFVTSNQILAENFVAIGSLAKGGLSNAWGCGVAKFSPEELMSFPFSSSDIEKSYEHVARRIGISGAQEDDLNNYFGLDRWSQPPIRMDALHTRILENYLKKRTHFASTGFRMGRSRVAVLSKNLGERQACDLLGNCLWGCHKRALYSAIDEIPYLKRHPNFHYREKFIVDKISKGTDGYLIESIGSEEILRARRIILAAGTLATTRLALKALNFPHVIPMLSCPTAAFLLWLPRMFGEPKVDSFSLGQLSFTLKLKDNISGFGSTFSTTSLPVSEFVQHIPFRKRVGIRILRELLSSCLVGNIFLPGHLSTTKVHLKSDGTLKIEGGYNACLPELFSEARKDLIKAYWRLGCILFSKSFTMGHPGGDIHYAGTFPMRLKPTLGETNALGEICGLEGIHIVDGACLPVLPEKPHTLTIMANADRISKQLTQSVNV